MAFSPSLLSLFTSIMLGHNGMAECFSVSGNVRCVAFNFWNSGFIPQVLSSFRQSLYSTRGTKELSPIDLYLKIPPNKKVKCINKTLEAFYFFPHHILEPMSKDTYKYHFSTVTHVTFFPEKRKASKHKNASQ